MRPLFFTWTLWAGVICLFATGCQSTRQASKSSKTLTSAAASERQTEAEARKLAHAHALYGMGVIHEVNEEQDAALEDYYRAALEDPEDEALALEVSTQFLKRKQFDKALEVVSRAAANPDASGQLFARLGLLYAHLGKEPEALQASRSAIERSPDSLQGYQNVFLLHLQKKRFPEAIAALDQAAAYTNASPEFLLGLTEMYIGLIAQAPKEAKSLQTKAVAVLDRSARIPSQHPPVRLMMAEQFSRLGMPERAAAVYEEILKDFSHIPALRERARARLSEIYLRQKDNKKAEEQLQALAGDDPTNPQVYIFLGNLALEDKDPKKAIENFARALLLNPELEQVYYELANAQLMGDKTDEALLTLDKARGKFKENFVLEFLSALSRMRLKELDKAIHHFSSAEALAQTSDPKRLNEFFYFQFGAACERKGDFPQAEQHLKKALEIAPDFVEAQNYLGYMWADRGQNLEEAHKLIEKAVTAEPTSGAYLDSLGWVLFKLGNPQQALEKLRLALENLEEPDATIYEHLGDVYQTLEQTEQAREAFTKSLSIEKNDKVEQKLRTLDKGQAP